MTLLQELSDQELATHALTYHYGDPLAAELAKRLEAYDGADDELYEAQQAADEAQSTIKSDSQVAGGACGEIRHALDMLQDQVDDPENEADDIQRSFEKYAAEIRTLCDRIEF